ncbi:MAG: MBL fold metallo-hydrolase [Tenericutes bacterium]|nr:MBL fold metallo-hydrolase [Mycoplasmatota bacterium]
MKISILANDKALPDFKSEHGLSVHINHPIYQILFDTGYTNVYLQNAKKLGINLSTINYIVLSHGHYDHTGGVRYYPAGNSVKQLIIHQDAYFPKYAKESYLRFNGVPFVKGSIPWINRVSKEIVGYERIAPSFSVLGDIVHKNTNTKFYLDGALDDFHDEIILILEEENELSLFMGCSHFNVMNGIKKVQEKFPEKRLKNLLAGMHLGSSSISDIEEIANYIEKCNFDKIIPLHCTGDKAIEYFKTRFKDKCFDLKAGDQLEI